MAKFKNPTDKTIPAMEAEILEFWKQNKIFEKSVDSRPADNLYVFYDGPPFISGMPHYGHFLGSIAKDIIPRYWTMKGKRVERVWGWDAHGITVESKVQKELGIPNRRDIENYGLLKFTEACYEYTSRISSEWQWYIDRIGRWVDIEHAYKTLDQDYMESVMWAFKQLYDKNMIYEGVRTSLYCTTCGTPVSNFEIAMDNSYKDMEDPAVTVKFPLKYHKTGRGVGVVITNEKGEILMSKRNEAKREQTYGIIGGKMEENESDPLETAKRECLEEIGVVPNDLKVVGSSIDVFEGRIFHTYHISARLDSSTEMTPDNSLMFLEWIRPEGIPWDNIHIPTKNSLRDVLDLAEFKEVKENLPNIYALAWTTTPWTLPSNRALVVNEAEEYVTVLYNDEFYVLAKKRVEEVFKDKQYEIYDEYSGKELVNLNYTPLYDFYKSKEGEFKVYSFDQMATVDEGTGIVHSAPGFGEVDTQMGNHYELTTMLTVDDEGKFMAGDNGRNPFEGMFYKKADKYIMEDLTTRDLLFKNEKIVHRFPYHDRCNTPLIQKSQSSWFLRVSEIKDQMIKNNENINWVPEYLKEGRFKKGIEQAPDWCLSRTRFWATPMPVWEAEDGDRIVVSSVKEIEELSGQKVKDLHRPYIDELTFNKNGKTYKRRPEVLDSWFEAGSMPYAQIHYPFENEEKFKKNYPGDYIVEYIGQVRAWFYVTHVLSTALFNSNSFRNVISTGTIAGTDGRKMSKTYGNYTDPKDVLLNIGGDALRLYLMNSPLMVGNNSNFDEVELKNKSRNVLNPLWNSAKFFLIYANLNNWEPAQKAESEAVASCFRSKNILDKWIKTRLNETVAAFAENIEKYMTPDAVQPVEDFVDDLSNWYVRRSRDRINSGDQEALSTLYEVLMTFAKASAPVIPFMAESMYLSLKSDDMPESVHLCMYPEYDKSVVDQNKELLDQMKVIKQICSLGSAVRKTSNVPVRQPLKEMTVTGVKDNLKSELVELIKDELNVKNVLFAEHENQQIDVSLDLTISEELQIEGNMRELMREIQKLRKEACVEWDAKVNVQFENSEKFQKAVDKFSNEIKSKTLVDELTPGDEFKIL